MSSPSLRDLRKKANLTQKELAEKTGLRQATISELENGKASPQHQTLKTLSDALDCSIDTVVKGIHASIPPISHNAIEALQADWDFLQGLDSDLRTGLAQSLVTEWTHNSTGIEGNTISAGDTLFVLTQGLTVSGKSLREHQEIHGHAQAIALLAGWAKGKLPVKVQHLHQLHQAIQTGAVIDSLAPTGAWKVEPNGTMLITTQGKTQWHEYATPRDIPTLMKQWIQLLKRSLPTTSSTPTTGSLIQSYTSLHLAFATIHPYADGNGRMARLLANLPLLRAGWQPLVIDLSERRNYISLLGDYTLARGEIKPTFPIISANKELDHLQSFFADQYKKTQSLIQTFHHQQATRLDDHSKYHRQLPRSSHRDSPNIHPV